MIEYKVCSQEDINSVKELYIEVFQEKDEATQLFFENVFSTDITYIAKENNRLVAMLFMIPSAVNGVKTAYMFAVATKENYRGTGIASALIDYALKNTDAEICTTLPATKSLYEFYRKLGFADLSVNVSEVSKTQLEKIAEPYPVTELFVNGYCGIRNRVLKKDFLFWNNKYIDFALRYNEIYGAKIIRTNYGYAVAYEEENVCIVSEIVCDNENAPYLLWDILNNSDCEKFKFRLSPQQNIFESDSDIFGMVKYLSEYRTENIYCSLTLD